MSVLCFGSPLLLRVKCFSAGGLVPGISSAGAGLLLWLSAGDL